MSKLTTLNLEALLLSLLLVGTWALLMVFPVPSVPSPMEFVTSLVPAHLRGLYRNRGSGREREGEGGPHPPKKLAGAASRARTELSHRMRMDRIGGENKRRYRSRSTNGIGNGSGDGTWESDPDRAQAEDSSALEGSDASPALSAGTSAGTSVCWSSHSAGGLRAAAPGAETPGAPLAHQAWAPGAVVFQGQCGECPAGALCSFHMAVRPPAQWAPGAHPRQRELRVLLVGPSRGLAHAQPLPPLDGSAFQISYQLWDPGMYRVSVRIPCGNLKWRKEGGRGARPLELATWQLLVTAPQGLAAGGALWNATLGTPGGPSPSGLPVVPSSEHSYSFGSQRRDAPSTGSSSTASRESRGSEDTGQSRTVSSGQTESIPRKHNSTPSVGPGTARDSEPKGLLGRIRPRKLRDSSNDDEPRVQGSKGGSGTGNEGGGENSMQGGSERSNEEDRKEKLEVGSEGQIEGGSREGASKATSDRGGASPGGSRREPEEMAALEAAADGHSPRHTLRHSPSGAGSGEGAPAEVASGVAGTGAGEQQEEREEGEEETGAARRETEAAGEGMEDPGRSWEEEVKARPCEGSSLQARWLRQEDGSYKWTPYACAQSLPVEDWVPALNRAGIREISLIGDSHQRVLTHHLLSLLAGRLRPDQAQWRATMTYNITHPGGAQLRLNMYFVKGIYRSNDAFGCGLNFRQNNSRPFFPAISPTADVNILEAGYWTGAYCKRPELAFAASLPGFLLWMENNLRAFALASKAATRRALAQQQALTSSGQGPSHRRNAEKGLRSRGHASSTEKRPRRGRRGPKGAVEQAAGDSTRGAPDAGPSSAPAADDARPVYPHPLLVYRSTPPRPTDKTGCETLTNVYLQYANEVARGLAPQLNATFFDSSQVEGPRYLDTCDKHHYSCAVRGRMVGEVGEADAAALVHFLIREQHKRRGLERVGGLP